MPDASSISVPEDALSNCLSPFPLAANVTTNPLTRDDLASAYWETLLYEPYPVQEEALLAWFTSDQGVLVCAPTGTGKTLIAEAAVFEALHRGTVIYYTTPLIALTEQKFVELQESAERWGFSAEDVGLITGNRRVRPEAPVRVVVAEILFNRLLRPDLFPTDDVHAVVMDEFHSFNDPERGVVWEFTLGLLPEHVRLLLLSATVGNAYAFCQWMRRTHGRDLELVQSDERKVPLTFQWIGDQLLNEFVEEMAAGDETTRKVPALIFCFNRDMCWNVAEQLKGKPLIDESRRKELIAELEREDWSGGAGPKLRQLLLRGVGVHHAGILPRYKRIVERLFQRKLLAATVCTETLAAGINLPARSVVLPSLMKGPPDRKRLIEPSSAHQIFGRAGRPQYDSQGFVFALAHEDDVRIQRWRRKYDQIPEDTKDPGLRKAKKALKKKMPKRRSTEQYWSEQQFQQLQKASPADLASQGALPWRLLAHILDASPEVAPIRELVGKRLLPPKQLEEAQRELTRMLLTLHRADYVRLVPAPSVDVLSEEWEAIAAYRPERAEPTERLAWLLHLRGVNPLFGAFVAGHLGIADERERLLAWEAILEMPIPVARLVRVPGADEFPPGPLATTRLDVQLLKLGLATPAELGQESEEDDTSLPNHLPWEERPRPLTLADKLLRLFHVDFPDVEVRIVPVWAAGELLEFGGDFQKFIAAHRLQKQEGILFRHLLRLILLVREFQQLPPPDVDPEAWRDELEDVVTRLTDTCHQVDPLSTERTLAESEEDAGELEE